MSERIPASPSARKSSGFAGTATARRVSRRAVGYVGDEPAQAADPASSAARNAFKRYLLTQYALVPILLARGPEGELVVGDFTASAHPTVVTPPGFVAVQDFGDGVVLFRRLPR